jgi:glutathione S-transferase
MSLCAQKVHVCLAEKGLDWEDRHIALRSGEHQKEWYRKLNRRAVVPTLIDEVKVIPESNVILEYLDERVPEPRLTPQDPTARADAALDEAARRGHSPRQRRNHHFWARFSGINICSAASRGSTAGFYQFWRVVSRRRGRPTSLEMN